MFAGAISAIAIGVVTGATAILISFIGFSETISFLPMINIHYPVKLNFFFQGISGMNFKFFDIAELVAVFLDLPRTSSPRGNRFENAGFDS